MSKNKLEMKCKLLKVLQKLKQVKKDLTQLSIQQKQFTFKSIMPKKLVTHKFINQTQIHDDKQNNFKRVNQSLNAKRNSVTKFPKAFSTSQLYNQLQSQQKTLKNTNNQMRDLKTTLLLQLNEIKSMERKEQSLRRTNEKIKLYNSQQKKNYRESQSKQKTQPMTSIQNYSQISKSIVCEKFNQSELFNSEISVAIPIVVAQNRIKTLRCQRGHQYYEGETNQKNQPHGNGRLQICCSLMPNQIGGNSLKDAQFYQGQFCNGNFDGFGTLSYRGGVKYVGQFKNGRRQGKGSLYYNGKAEIAKWDNDSFVSIM